MTMKAQAPSTKDVSIREIANLAGVSLATVSRVLNNSSLVTPKTRQRVLQAAKELNYHPNLLAQGLRTQRTDIVGLVINDVANPFYAQLTEVIQQELHKRGYSLILCSSSDDTDEQINYLKLLKGWNASAVIIAPAVNTNLDSPIWTKAAGWMVQVSRYLPGLGVKAVVSDNYGGVRQAVEHLIGLGYRRIAFLGGPMTINTGAERARGYQAALAGAGLPVSADLVLDWGFSENGGYRMARHFMTMRDPPEALFSASNLNTIGALCALREMGIAVPGDVAFVSFDDIKTGAILTPQLTAVSQRVREIGTETVALVLKLISGDTTREVVTVPTEFIVRESCGSMNRRPRQGGSSA